MRGLLVNILHRVVAEDGFDANYVTDNLPRPSHQGVQPVLDNYCRRRIGERGQVADQFIRGDLGCGAGGKLQHRGAP